MKYLPYDFPLSGTGFSWAQRPAPRFLIAPLQRGQTSQAVTRCGLRPQGQCPARTSCRLVGDWGSQGAL